MNHSLKSKIAVAMAIGAAFTNVALAGDDHKTYPGSYCRSVSDGYSIDSPTLGTGPIENHSTTNYIAVYCPIIRDYMAADTGIRRVRIWFHNNNTDGRIACRVTTRAPNGAEVKSKLVASDYGARQGSFTVEYGGDAGVYRFYTLACYLPPTVENFRFPRVEGFRVEEFD